MCAALVLPWLTGCLSAAVTELLLPLPVATRPSPKLHLTEPPFCQVSRLSLELGDRLPDPGSQLSPAVPPLSEPFKMEAKKSEAAEAPPTWEEESAGVEDVRSQTYSKERLQRPPPAEPGTGGFGEFRPWVPRPSQEDAHLTAGAQGRPTEELRLEVKPSQEDHGYIVTGTE